MMKHSVFIFLALLIAGVMFAGCTGTQSPAAPVATPTPTSVAPPVATTAEAMPSFTMGDHYLAESYSFQSENDVVVKEFRVDNPAWGIEFDVLPLNDNTIYCWFEMKVTNADTGHSETYGYDRENGFVLKNQIPMYTTGPYKIEMKGNRVKVDVTAAKRNP
ncbi:MAG: hypothetical protein WC620_07540 [Methanoregula sp.]|jgi:hypothetical protein